MPVVSCQLEKPITNNQQPTTDNRKPNKNEKLATIRSLHQK